MQVDTDSLRSSLVKAGVVSRTFDHPAMETVSRLGCTLQAFMDERAVAVVRCAGRRAVLHHYEHGATSYLSRYELHINSNSQAQLRRRQTNFGVRRRAHNAAMYWPKFAMPRFTRRGDIAYDAIVATGP